MENSATEYCRTLIDYKWLLHLRGDTFGSSHLAEAIEYGVVPIFTHLEQLQILPFRDSVDWGGMGVLVPLTGDHRRSGSGVWSVLTGWGERRERIEKARRFVSWTVEGGLAFEMFLREVLG